MEAANILRFMYDFFVRDYRGNLSGYVIIASLILVGIACEYLQPYLFLVAIAFISFIGLLRNLVGP